MNIEHGDPDNLPAIQLSLIPFDRAFNDPRVFATVLEPIAKARLLRALGLGLAEHAETSVQLLRQGQQLEVIFSGPTAAKLRSGEYHLPVDPDTALYRADARDTGGRIKEFGKIRAKTPGHRAIVSTLTSAAHLVTAVDTQAQLQTIIHKIDQLLTFVHADRLGELRGEYNAICQTLEREPNEARVADLRGHSHTLYILAGRYLETAWAKLRAIKDPSDIGIWEALTTLQSTARAELERDLGSVLGDLRAMDFAHLLYETILMELTKPAMLAAHNRIVRGQLDEITPLLLERLGFLNHELRCQVSAKLDLQRSHCFEALPDSVTVVCDDNEPQGK